MLSLAEPVIAATRYDLGWYAGRVYGLLAASFLLIVLPIENGAHYVRLAHLSVELSAANLSLEQLSLQDGLTGLANRRYLDQYRNSTPSLFIASATKKSR